MLLISESLCALVIIITSLTLFIEIIEQEKQKNNNFYTILFFLKKVDPFDKISNFNKLLIKIK